MIELGKIQDEDVLLLQAIIKMTCPSKLVELGYLNGYSTRKFLEVMRPDAKLISYDNTVRNSNIVDSRFTFKNLSQTDYEEEDVDFIFFDASHNFELNIETLKKVENTLNNGAIIAVHDTGLWNEMVMDTIEGYWIENGYAHRPDERKFVAWIKDHYKDYQIINFHTLKELRHGITLLQKYKGFKN